MQVKLKTKAIKAPTLIGPEPTWGRTYKGDGDVAFFVDDWPIGLGTATTEMR
jgi:hypothetical protein